MTLSTDSSYPTSFSDPAYRPGPGRKHQLPLPCGTSAAMRPFPSHPGAGRRRRHGHAGSVPLCANPQLTPNSASRRSPGLTTPPPAFDRSGTGTRATGRSHGPPPPAQRVIHASPPQAARSPRPGDRQRRQRGPQTPRSAQVGTCGRCATTSALPRLEPKSFTYRYGLPLTLLAEQFAAADLGELVAFRRRRPPLVSTPDDLHLPARLLKERSALSGSPGRYRDPQASTRCHLGVASQPHGSRGWCRVPPCPRRSAVRVQARREPIDLPGRKSER